MTASQRRHYFETNVKFRIDDPDATAKRLVDAWEKAALSAEQSARRAIQSQDKKYQMAAFWDEAVCSTIERCLCLIDNNNAQDGFGHDEEIELPEFPGCCFF